MIDRVMHSSRIMDVRGVHYTWAPNDNNIEVRIFLRIFDVMLIRIFSADRWWFIQHDPFGSCYAGIGIHLARGDSRRHSARYPRLDRYCDVLVAVRA